MLKSKKQFFSCVSIRWALWFWALERNWSTPVQECEMDLVARYQGNANDKVHTCFWNSLFFGHATGCNLVSYFTDGLSGLDFPKQILVSRDGPSVNWKFHNEITKSREKIGSWNLHDVHGALKFVAESFGWNFKKLVNRATIYLRI